MEKPPPAFFRVQFEHSGTLYTVDEGFEAQGHYMMGNCDYIDKAMIEEHLTCQTMIQRRSPFISVFDSENDALKRASFHLAQGFQEVFIAEIDTSSLELHSVEIEFADKTVQLPLWQTSEHDTFIAVSQLRHEKAYDIDLTIGGDSEWLALDYIPKSLIREVYRPDAAGNFWSQSEVRINPVSVIVTPPPPPPPQLMPPPSLPVRQRVRRGAGKGPRLQWMETFVHPGRGPRSRLM
ncbi:MAG: hypothetical protein Q9218_005348 [Villophora microphyllina]